MKPTVFLFAVASFSLCNGQDYPRKDVDVSSIAEELFAIQDEGLDYEELFENMAQLLINPVDLNDVSIEELRFLYILNEEQIQNLIRYRNEQRDFLSVYELQAIPGFDLVTINKLIPFVKVDDRSTSLKGLLHRITEEKNNYLITRYERTIEPKEGFRSLADSSNKFKGSEDKLYLRFRTSRPNDFSFGFTAEKDAGEQILWSPSTKQYGFDYWSAHAQIKNKGRLKNLIIGDFQSQFGQGLILGGAFGTGKGAETVTAVRRSNVGFLPYSSVNEAIFFRGIAGTWKATKTISVSGFLSALNRDASISNDSAEFISSFQITGLHRNARELAGRKQVKEKNLGIVINLKNKKIDAGLIYHVVSLGDRVSKKESPYNQFTFSGYENQNIGIFLNFNYNNFTFFSEGVKTLSGGSGIVAGTIGSMGANFDISLLYRNYARNFQTFNSNAFAEGTLQNESGFYWGWKYRFSRKYNLAGYVDLFRFPWLRFRSYAPSSGHEWFIRFNYQPSKHILVFAQLREEVKARNSSSNEPRLYVTAEGRKRNYWLSFESVNHQKLKLKTRAQFSTFEIGAYKTNGFVLLQDISIDFGKLKFTTRYAIFDTEDFDNRQYVFENDVWLAYSLLAYNGTGLRNYILLEYNMNKKLSFWLRYGYTRYTNQDEIGSGSETITGNKRNDVKFQARIKF